MQIEKQIKNTLSQISNPNLCSENKTSWWADSAVAL